MVGAIIKSITRHFISCECFQVSRLEILYTISYKKPREKLIFHLIFFTHQTHTFKRTTDYICLSAIYMNAAMAQLPHNNLHVNYIFNSCRFTKWTYTSNVIISPEVSLISLGRMMNSKQGSGSNQRRQR